MFHSDPASPIRPTAVEMNFQIPQQLLEPTIQLWRPPTLYQNYLAEKWCRKWLEEHPGYLEPEEEDEDRLIQEVDINSELKSATRLRQDLKAAKVFSNQPGLFKGIQQTLDVAAEATPYRGHNRPFGPAQTEILNRWIEDQVTRGMWERAGAECKWASYPHIAPTWEKNEFQTRLVKIRVCGDYREVNDRLENIPEVVPNIRDIKGKLAGRKYFAKFDMAAGFNNVLIDEPYRDILAVRFPKGLFRPVRMPFGPKNNPSKYQRIVESSVS